MPKSIPELRQEYSLGALNKTSIDPNPLRQFQRWLNEAIAAQLPEPNAMILATVDSQGSPSARAMLLKGLEDQGFVFFSNYLSIKGRQLAENPRAALVFLWKELERQVRVEGTVRRISRAESEAYFYSRPLGNRLGALASQQSQVVASRKVLEERFAALNQRFADGNIPMPEHWGGYRLIPVKIEFWQGRQNRLHDRLRYWLQADGSWLLERLEP
jgi:pyridoxamine 5'-phosphate oxidase